MTDTSYNPLRDILDAAYNQASAGKGQERHANGRPFSEQPIMRIQEMVGPGFATGQAIKKIQESERMDADAAERELLGAIVYLAGAILHKRGAEVADVGGRKMRVDWAQSAAQHPRGSSKTATQRAPTWAEARRLWPQCFVNGVLESDPLMSRTHKPDSKPKTWRDNLPDWAGVQGCWRATDRNGDVYVYSEQPSADLRRGVWAPSGIMRRVHSNPIGSRKWMNTLIWVEPENPTGD